MINIIVLLLVGVIVPSSALHATEYEDLLHNPNFMLLLQHDMLTDCPPMWIDLFEITDKECMARLGGAKKKCIQTLIGNRKEQIDKSEEEYYSKHYLFCQVFSVMGCDYNQNTFDRFFSVINKYISIPRKEPSDSDLASVEEFFIESCPAFIEWYSANKAHQPTP